MERFTDYFPGATIELRFKEATGFGGVGPDDTVPYVEADIVIAKSGVSMNGVDYPDEVLEAAAPMWTGRPMFLGHNSQDDLKQYEDGHPDRYAGKIKKSWWDAIEHAIKARAVIFKDSVVKTIQNARKAGVEPYGISLDVYGDADPAIEKSTGRSIRRMKRINAAFSADLVITPSAKGQVERWVASCDLAALTGDNMNRCAECGARVTEAACGKCGLIPEPIAKGAPTAPPDPPTGPKSVPFKMPAKGGSKVGFSSPPKGTPPKASFFKSRLIRKKADIQEFRSAVRTLRMKARQLNAKYPEEGFGRTAIGLKRFES